MALEKYVKINYPYKTFNALEHKCQNTKIIEPLTFNNSKFYIFGQKKLEWKKERTSLFHKDNVRPIVFIYSIGTA